MKTGSIIFFTKRHKKPIYRIFISYMIAVFTRKKKQKLADVKVHSAIIYEHNGVFKVRDMDKHGDEHYTLEYFIAKYKDRIEIKLNPFASTEPKIAVFEHMCKTEKVLYDYTNTFVFQVIKRFSGFFIGKITTYKRMCAEDVQINFNYLVPGYFKTPEETNPNDLYEKIKEWKSYEII